MTLPNTVTECPFEIGNTPLTPFALTLNGLRHELLVKEERCNAFGSVKDRVAWYILSQTIAEKGAVDAVIKSLELGASQIPAEFTAAVDRIARSGGTPLAVVRDGRLLGVVQLVGREHLVQQRGVQGAQVEPALEVAGQ